MEPRTLIVVRIARRSAELIWRRVHGQTRGRRVAAERTGAVLGGRRARGAVGALLLLLLLLRRKVVAGR